MITTKISHAVDGKLVLMMTTTMVRQPDRLNILSLRAFRGFALPNSILAPFDIKSLSYTAVVGCQRCQCLFNLTIV